MIHDITYYKKIQNALDSTSLKQTALRNSIARINRDFKKTINWEMVTSLNRIWSCLLLQDLMQPIRR